MEASNPSSTPSHLMYSASASSSVASAKCDPIWWTKDTTAIVTGANRGIGFWLAKKLVESGLTVVLTARNAERGLRAVESLKTQFGHGDGRSLHFAVLDISDQASISAFVSWFKAQFGVLDILVNNAAVSFNDVHGNSVEHAETVIKTNYYGAKSLTEALLPLFRRSPTSKSRILNLTSRLGSLQNVRNPSIRAMLQDENNNGPITEDRIQRVVTLFLNHVKEKDDGAGGWNNVKVQWPEIWPDYSVSKLALNAYSRMLARRLCDSNIAVNCYCPGFTQTGMTGGKGSRPASVAGTVGAMLALLPPDQLPTGKFASGESLSLRSRI